MDSCPAGYLCPGGAHEDEKGVDNSTALPNMVYCALEVTDAGYELYIQPAAGEVCASRAYPLPLASSAAPIPDMRGLLADRAACQPKLHRRQVDKLPQHAADAAVPVLRST